MKDKIKLKNKQFWVPGIALMLSMILLIVFGQTFDMAFSRFPAVGVIVVELICFGGPALVVYYLRDDKFPIRMRRDKHQGMYGLQYIGFTVLFALTVSFLSFLANLAIYLLTGSMEITLTSVVSGAVIGSRFSFISFIAIAVVPPIVEELFLRGAIFSAMENVASTWICILFSGLCFALLHANLYNFIGPFIAGCAYAFLSYSYDSIVPAVIAHFINNLYYYIINHLVTVYSSFGIWHYFTFINLILFLLSLYCTLRLLETQLKCRRLLPFAKRNGKTREAVFDIIGNPGFFIFVFASILTVILS